MNNFCSHCGSKIASSNLISIAADYKGFDIFVEQLQVELPKLGVYIEEDPLTKGSDMIGILLSKSPITEDMLDQYIKENVDMSEDEEEE